MRAFEDRFVLRRIMQLSIHAPIRQQALHIPEGTAAELLPHGIKQVHQKIVEAKTMLEDWQGPSSVKPAPIENKEEKGGVAFVKQGNNYLVKKDPKGKCHGAAWSMAIYYQTAKSYPKK